MIIPPPIHTALSKLLSHIATPAIISTTSCIPQAWGKLSDETYARDYARERWRVQRWAPKRISYELRKRGVSRDVIERVLLWLRTVRPLMHAQRADASAT